MESTAPKPFVFVLMPFGPEFDDVYQLGIKAACREAGTYCERLDEQIFHENMLERIYNQISKADIIVADMSGKNPNVFYEVGYAHALNKIVLILTNNADDIPFDLKHYPHLVYDKISFMKNELTHKLNYFKKMKDKNIKKLNENYIEYYVNQCQLVPNMLLKASIERSDIPGGASHERLLSFTISLHNSSTSSIELPSKIVLCGEQSLGPSLSYKYNTEYDYLLTPDNFSLFSLRFGGKFLPDDWRSTEFKVRYNEKGIIPFALDLRFKIYSTEGVSVIPCKLEVVK